MKSVGDVMAEEAVEMTHRIQLDVLRSSHVPSVMAESSKSSTEETKLEGNTSCLLRLS